MTPNRQQDQTMFVHGAVPAHQPEYHIPPDMEVFCGVNITDLSITGTAYSNFTTNPTDNSFDDQVADIHGCPYLKTIERTWTFRDAIDTTNILHTSAQHIHVKIDTPRIEYPLDFRYPVGITYSHQDVTGVPTFTSSCPEYVNITSSDSFPNGTSCGYQYINRTWTITQQCGRNEVQTYTPHHQFINIDIADINFPDDVQFPAGNNIDLAVTGTISFTSNDIVRVSYSDFTKCDPPPPDGVTYLDRYWTFTQVCDNNNNDSRTYTHGQIIELDIKKPTVETSNLFVNNVKCGDSLDPSSTGLPNYSDNIDPNPILTYADTFEPIGGNICHLTRTFTVTDRSGNHQTLAQQISISDTTRPILTIPADERNEIRGSSILPNDLPNGGATAVAACSGKTIIPTYEDTIDADGNVRRYWNAVDECKSGAGGL